MKILLIGARGMLGHDLANVFAAEDLCVADLPEWDITNPEDLSKKIANLKPEAIINCGAYTDVEGAEDNADLAFKINAEGVKNLADICQKGGIKIVHFSTEYVFDGENQSGYDENSQPKPINVYGQSKAQGEKFLKESGAAYYLVRTSWLYGHWPQAGKPRGMNFVDKILEKAEKQNEIKVVNDQFGKPTFTKDLALAVKSLLESGRPLGVYHLINENSGSWFELAKEAVAIKKLSAKIIPVGSSEFPGKVKRPAYAVLLNTKLPKLRTWQEALKEYLAID